MSHRLYCIPAGQRSMPLGQSVIGTPRWLVGFTSDGKEVNVELTNTHVCPEDCPSTAVWVAIFHDTCLPYLDLRKSLSVECTGLGGADLNSPIPWDLLIRTSRHHEEVYGPSLARLECPGAYNQENVMYVGLRLTKTIHEFLMLHCFAIDSAQIWDDLDSMRYLTFAHAPTRRARAFRAHLWVWQSCSWWRMSLLLLDRALLERWRLRLLSWRKNQVKERQRQLAEEAFKESPHLHWWRVHASHGNL